MVRPTYAVRIDWNQDTDFGDVGEVVTSRVLYRSGLEIQFGRDQARALAPMGAGSAAFELNNISKDYSPNNGSSPLTGVLGAGRVCSIQATWASTTYDLCEMLIDDYVVKPARMDRSVGITLSDGLSTLRDAKCNTTLYQGITTGQAIGYILDNIGWPVADRDIDTGVTVLRQWWEEGTDAFAAVEKLVISEGPPAICFIAPDGRLTFRDRTHRTRLAASTSSQGTFRDSGAEPKFSEMTYDVGWKDIVNSCTFSVDMRVPGSAGTVVWTSEETYVVAVGSPQTVIASMDDPVFNAITPVEATDFTRTAASGSLSVSLDKTSGQTIMITLTAATATQTITALQLRATPLPPAPTLQNVTAEDSASITKYHRRSYGQASDAEWLNKNDADAVANLIVATRKEKLPMVTITVRSAETNRLTAQLARDISDRITIVETQTSTNGAFYIETVQHVADENILSTTWGCEQVPSSGIDDPATVMIIGSGTLGSKVLGR